MKYIDADKLIATLERQNVDKKVIQPLIRIIDSLQQEQPGIGSAAVLLICVIVGVVTEPKQPKTIETKHPPQIDTIITIKNHVPDTTYVYTFIKKKD